MVGLLEPELVLNRDGSCTAGEGGCLLELKEGRENHFEGLDKNPVIEGDVARGNERNVEEEVGGVVGDELVSVGR
jgi:hypothetical protein